MLVRKTYEFKFYAAARNRFLTRQIETAAKAYNHCIKLHQRYWKLYHKHLGANRLKKHLTKLKKIARFSYLLMIGSQALQDIAERIDRAYKLWWTNLKKKKKTSPPKKKDISKYKSFTLKQAGWKLLGDNSIVIQKKRYKYFKSREVEGKVKTVTVKRDACGDIFLYIVVEQEIEEIKVRSGKSVGFDYGFHDSMLIGVSEDEDIKAPSFFRKNQEKFKQANRALSLKEGGSNHKRAARLNRAKLYRRIAWQRKDYHYKLAHELCDQYSLICLEDLSHKFMMKGHGKKAGDYGFAAFLKILEWVALKRGVTIVKVDRFFPSSQLCHCCGYQNPEVKDLSIREWDCPECHAHHDRDRNAAMNILKEGLRIAS